MFQQRCACECRKSPLPTLLNGVRFLISHDLPSPARPAMAQSRLVHLPPLSLSFCGHLSTNWGRMNHSGHACHCTAPCWSCRGLVHSRWLGNLVKVWESPSHVSFFRVVNNFFKFHALSHRAIVQTRSRAKGTIHSSAHQCMC